MKSVRNRGKKEIIHPIFLECKEHVENPFWKSLFEDFAYGKYPKQMYVTQNQQIQSSNRNNFFQYSFKGKEISTIILDVQDLLLTHTNLISNEEIIVKKNDNVKYKKDDFTHWKDIKKKYIRDILIMEYCTKLRSEKRYSLEESIRVYEKIMYYTMFNAYMLEIQMNDNKISSIKGIIFNPDNTITIEKEEDIIKQEPIYEIPDQVSHYCKRYILSLSKKIKMNKNVTD